MVKNFLLDLLFPKFCFGCQKEGGYLCQDCRATIDILTEHQEFREKELKDLYWATDYQGPLAEKLINHFKYEPFIKELAKPLSLLIINHFQLIEKQKEFQDFVLIPVPLHQKRLRWRGFNQAEELARELSLFLKIPLLKDCLIKMKETLPQTNLSDQERKENVLGVFLVKDNIKGKNILLVDDTLKTGSTLKECAQVLNKAGANKVIGIVIARE